MQVLSQSPFLQALGYAIINSLWQVALLWLLTIIINSSLRLSPHRRYQIALSSQLGGFVWFVITFQFYFVLCAKALLHMHTVAIDNVIIYGQQAENIQTRIFAYLIKAEQFLPYLSVAYLVWLLLLCARWLQQYQCTRSIRKEGIEKAGMNWRLFVQNTAALLSIKQKVQVYYSSLVKSPLTVGFLKPVILIPFASINYLTQEQLEAVLLHELAHIKRADYLLNILVSLVETTLFFNPFTRLLGNIIEKERENACDDWVLQFQYNANMYAEALLRIACLQTLPALSMKAAGKNGGDLLYRVKRLLNKQETGFNYKQQLTALMLTTILLTATAFFQPSVRQANHQQTVAKPRSHAVVTPMVAQVENPLFSPVFFLSKPLQKEVRNAISQIDKTSFDTIINASLQQAGNALTEVTPALLNVVSSDDWQKNLIEAGKNAEQAIANMDWSSINEHGTLIDSTAIHQSLKFALDNGLAQIDKEKLRKDLEKAQQQIAQLNKNRTLFFNKEVLNASLENAFALLNENFIKAQADAATKIAPPPPAIKSADIKKLMNKWNEKQLQLRLEQKKREEWNDEFSLNVSPPVIADANNYNKVQEKWDYAYTNPVYIEAPEAPADDRNFVSNCNTGTPEENSALPTISIIKYTSGSHINIIIEIHQ